ncbi:hypothetical protein [Brevibacillus borstelensis]|uniref:hypothetical protein n=1 Tax=Brevibacillus borstelensis TaxID=45462 RepID=UPI002E1DDED2|nr:hypothetical protein [Brevibacillus borstelensis]
MFGSAAIIVPMSKSLIIPDKMAASTLSTIWITVLILGMFKFSPVWLPKFIIGPNKIPVEIIKVFSHRSYLFCISYFAIYVSLIIYTPILLSGVHGNGLDLKLILALCGVNTVLWFMYHLLNGTATVKQVKARVSLYAAISGTLSPLLVGNIFESVTPILVSIGIGYLWLQHFTEQYELEQEMISKLRDTVD